MGGIFSSMFGWLFRSDAKVGTLPVDMGPDADIPDPNTNMTPRQIAYVNMTWNPVRPDLRSHGVKFFLLFFETHPHLQTRFKAFTGKKLSDLVDSKRLAGHATTVMTAIDSYISNLDDVTMVVEMLETTGKNHIARGISKDDFELLPPVLIKYLRENLGSLWSKEAEEAWVALFKVVNSVILKAYDD